MQFKLADMQIQVQAARPVLYDTIALRERVISQAVRQLAVPGPGGRHGLGGGKAPCMLLQTFGAEELPPHRRPVPRKQTGRMLEYAANDHGPTRGKRIALTLTASTPEQASASLWCGAAGQQSMPTQVTAVVHPEFAPRFAIRCCHQSRGVVRREFPGPGLRVAGRNSGLEFAHGILQC
jgi:hypothetical protein